MRFKKFYNSKVDFGLVTYNLSNFKPKLLTKKQIPKDKLKSYVMASATCFPAFKMKDIDGDKYIDGGYYDVLPINLAIDMGATDIVAVDLKSFGIRRIVKNFFLFIKTSIKINLLNHMKDKMFLEQINNTM